MLDDESMWMELDRDLHERGRSLGTAAESGPKSLTRRQLCGAAPPQGIVKFGPKGIHHVVLV